MKVVIGPYKNWIGPYQIAEALCFWVKKTPDEYGIARKPAWVHHFGRWLSEDKHGEDSWLTKVCQWIESHRHRQVYVRVDKYDTWSMDHTLALITLPMLKQLKATKHGSPMVEDDDVPYGQGLRSYETDKLPKNEYDPDENWERRWNWVLDEMIFAFQCKLDDSWQDEFRSGEHDLQSIPCEWDDAGKPTLYKMIHGPLDTYVCDYEAMKVVEQRIQRGFELFGKYYQNLWD